MLKIYPVILLTAFCGLCSSCSNTKSFVVPDNKMFFLGSFEPSNVFVKMDKDSVVFHWLYADLMPRFSFSDTLLLKT